jgi:SAM-dependent methyltransferase
MTDPRDRMQEIVDEHEGEYTAVFEKVYAAAASGEVDVPWGEVSERHHWLRRWASERELDGTGKRALVVGCGYGHDAEFVASLGYETTAFDVSPSAIEAARERHPGSAVQYTVADLFAPPADWAQAFDLVVEIATVQALPRAMRRQVTDAIGRFVAPGGTLIVIMVVQEEPFTDAEYGPWPMTRAELDAFATGGLRAVNVEARDAEVGRRWVAEFTR